MRNGLFTSFDAWFKGICVCLLTMLALSANARAQTQITTGTIQGTVSDANGAVLPGANVEIKNLDTNLSKIFPLMKVVGLLRWPCHPAGIQ